MSSCTSSSWTSSRPMRICMRVRMADSRRGLCSSCNAARRRCSRPRRKQSGMRRVRGWREA
jgi:hypothetical protein